MQAINHTNDVNDNSLENLSITHEKTEMHKLFEKSCPPYFLEGELEWNQQKGSYADPRTREMFRVFCQGYHQCLLANGSSI